MNNVSNNKNWDLGTVQVHVDTSPTLLIKSKNNEKLDKDCVKIKLCRYPTSAKSDLYELKMALFDNGEPEELLLFIKKLSNDYRGVRNAH